jgi:Ala-tRNA(Pro) deacylase
MSQKSIFEQIISLLDEHHVSYALSEHEAVRTSEQAAAVRGASLKTGAKSMILKAKDEYVLVVLPADKLIDWKKVRILLGSNSVRFATEVEAEEVAHVQMGSVPPFGDILGIKAYYDAQLFENEEVNFNPGSVRHTIKMSSVDLKELIHPTIVDLVKE